MGAALSLSWEGWHMNQINEYIESTPAQLTQVPLALNQSFLKLNSGKGSQVKVHLHFFLSSFWCLHNIAW